jgi:hypothetical protein
MKTTIRTIALASLVAIAALSQTAVAQIGWLGTRVDVPFAFNCGSQHFAAGVYTLSTERQNLLLLRKGDHTALILIQAGFDPTRNKSGYVAFHKYGEQYFFAEYAPANGSIRASVLESKAERRAARDYAANHHSPSTVQLALLSNDSGNTQSK